MNVVLIREERRKPTRKTVSELLASMPEHKEMHDALVKCMTRCIEEFEFRTSDTIMMSEILKPPLKEYPAVPAKKVTFEKSVL